MTKAETKVEDQAGKQRYLILAAWLVVVVLAAVQVAVTHWHRDLVGRWQKLEEQQLSMQQEYGRLMLQRSALSAHGRVETVARKKLNMQEPEDIQVIAPQK